MKLHLPIFLRKSLLSCLSAIAGLTAYSSVAWADAQNLTFEGATLKWNTNADNQVFVNEEASATAFTAGDNVTFTHASTVTLEENISAGKVSIGSEADVTINTGNYTMDFDTLTLLGGSLDIGGPLGISAGRTLEVGFNGSVLKSELSLADEGSLRVDFSGSGTATSLNNTNLILQSGTALQLSNAGYGDGKTYTLLTGVSGLVDAQGNTISLDSSNNTIANYFDDTLPGTGFWKYGFLQLSDGNLQIVLHDHDVKEAVTITTHQAGNDDYQYYSGVAFENISSTSDGGAIYA